MDKNLERRIARIEAKIALLKQREKHFRDILSSGSSSEQSLREAHFEVLTLPVQISGAEQELASLKARRSTGEGESDEVRSSEP